MKQQGFTLIELMVVVIVVGLLAAIAIPNYLTSQTRAREASVKSNMHIFQLAAEDFRLRGDSTYAAEADSVAALLQGAYRNPFDKSQGKNFAWEDRQFFDASASSHSGIVSYADSSGVTYNIKGQGRIAPIPLVLTNGR